MGHFDEMANLVAIKKLVDCGIALIPVNDAKEPFAPFKGKKKLGLVELTDAFRFYSQQEGKEVDKVAIRVGEISGWLFCIDVDSDVLSVVGESGFSERIYTDIQNLFPEIWDKLRIEKTPSGGLHIYYRCSGNLGVDLKEIKTCNIAYRDASERELELNPKAKPKCFIEFKASDGSLFTSYPSAGYQLVKDWKLEPISLEDHLRLIDILWAYNKVEKEQQVIRVNKSRDSIYLEGKTPFECFNESDSAEIVLEDLGWTRWKKYGGFETFKKPGGKKIGATFNPKKRTYAILTTGSDIESRCYKPSSLLVQEKFNGDAFKCYEYLIALGFGVIKPSVEKIEIKKALRNGLSELPANFSSEAREEFTKESANRSNKYRCGEFWVESIGKDGEIEYEISRELICKVSSEFGFRLYRDSVVLISGHLIKEIEDRKFFDILKSYIDQPDNIPLLDVYEDFLQKSGKFTISRLEELDFGMVVRSDKVCSYKFFSNCYVKIWKDGFEELRYEDLGEMKVWEKLIQNREFRFISVEFSEVGFKKGLYYEFIKNAIGWSQYLMKCIGFYAHDYRDEESYLIVTTEKCENPKDGGGSGKNIFWKLFGLTTTFKSTAGSMIKKDNQFLQSWRGERVFVMADVPKTFDFVFFKDMITDGAVVRKLYKDEYNVDVSEMAKLGASMNYSFDDADPGIKRRLRIVEFSDYYTTRGGVKTVHGKMFPKDWSEEEFLLFDNIMMACIQEYLIGDCIIERTELSDGGWAKKQKQNYTHLYDFIKDNIDDWVKLGRVSSKVLNDSYVAFRVDANINKPFSSFKINLALAEYCMHFEIPFVHTYRRENGEMADGVVWRDNGSNVKGRLFGEEARKFLSKIGSNVSEIEVESKQVSLLDENPPF
jgi:hypothetical protein